MNIDYCIQFQAELLRAKKRRNKTMHNTHTILHASLRYGAHSLVLPIFGHVLTPTHVDANMVHLATSIVLHYIDFYVQNEETHHLLYHHIKSIPVEIKRTNK